MLACRACRVPIAAPTGCGICDTVRQNLVVVGEAEEDRPSLSGTSSEMVSVLRRMLKKVDADLKNNPGSPALKNDALKLSNALAKLLETARKLVQDGVSAVDQMSFREQCELFVGWVGGLAPTYRAEVLSKLLEFEKEIAKPVELQGGN